MTTPSGRAPLPWEAPAQPPETPKPRRAPPTAAPRVEDPAAAAAHERALLKGRIHRKLLERLNLANLDKMEREQVVDAIRKVVHDLIGQEKAPLNFDEREELVVQVGCCHPSGAPHHGFVIFECRDLAGIDPVLQLVPDRLGQIGDQITRCPGRIRARQCHTPRVGGG